MIVGFRWILKHTGLLSCLTEQEVKKHERKEAARPVQFARQWTVCHGVGNEQEDGQNLSTQVNDILPQVPQWWVIFASFLFTWSKNMNLLTNYSCLQMRGVPLTATGNFEWDSALSRIAAHDHISTQLFGDLFVVSPCVKGHKFVGHAFVCVCSQIGLDGKWKDILVSWQQTDSRIKQVLFTIADRTEKSHAHEIREDWKPTFLSNDEFAQLMLEVTSFHITHIAMLSSVSNYLWTARCNPHMLNFSGSGRIFVGDYPGRNHTVCIWECDFVVESFAGKWHILILLLRLCLPVVKGLSLTASFSSKILSWVFVTSEWLGESIYL